MALVAFLALALEAPAILSQPGEAVEKRIETAVRADFATVRRLLELSRRVDEFGEPQTENELNDWVQKAREVRAEMIKLTNEGNTARVGLLDFLKRREPEDECPLVEPVVRYFEAENEFFRLAEKAQESTTVMVFNPNAPSPDVGQKLRALSELGAAVLKSYDALLVCQQDLLTKAGAQGLALSPVWDPAEQKSMLESYKAMSDLLNGREKE